MSIEIKVPPLPESVSEATIVGWHKQPGEAVSRDENLVDLETDKVVLEVPCPDDGVLKDILKADGETVTAGEILALVEAGAAAAAPAPKAATEAPKAASTEDLSPAVRKLVEENSLNPADITGTGKGGRITKEDVVNFMKAPKEEAKPAAPAPAPAAPVVASLPDVGGDRTEKRVPMTRLRQRVAERLIESQQTAAILTTFNEINMQPVIDLRNKYKDQFHKSHDVKLGFMSFFIKASIEALKRFPVVNASVDGTDIVYHGFYDVGVAVGSPRGLVVPIIRDADVKSFSDIEKEISDFGVRAQQGKLGIDELTGGTFTVTNGGIFGSMMSTPIINPPQSGILGMHATKDRAVVENGEVVVRPMMYIALSYDHRIIDGREAVQFLVTIKDMIEDPARLLLEV